MIVRDSYGIIVQQPSMDGGDSASRTGIMALCGSEQDKALLSEFMLPTGLVRHPFQANWDLPSLTSRDLLICYAAGQIDARLEQYATAWFVNADFLMPDVKLYLHKCAGTAPFFLLYLVAYPLLLISILWNARVTPNNEQNQIACICIVMGRPWISLLNRLHPDLKGNIMNYWSGWRDQAEIGEALYDKLQRTIGQAQYN